MIVFDSRAPTHTGTDHRHKPQTDTERAEQTHKHELLVLRFNKEQASDTQEAANEAEVLVQRQMKPPQQQPAASS